ncbi:MAG: HU family DNA-binding protein [Acidimicrobiales bacterium]
MCAREPVVPADFPERLGGGVNRSQLVEEIASTTGLGRREAGEAVDAFTSTVSSQVKAGNKVTIYGFGSFSPTAHKARTGRNPRTGDPVKIPASKGIRFSAAAGLKEELNSKKSAAKKTAQAKAAKASAAKAVKVAPAKATAKQVPAALKKSASARAVQAGPNKAVATKAGAAKKTAPANKSATAAKATRSTAKATKK